MITGNDRESLATISVFFVFEDHLQFNCNYSVLFFNYCLISSYI